MWHDKWSAEGLGLFVRANFDPGSLMAASLGATAIGGGLSAAGTIAGGGYAKSWATDIAQGARLSAFGDSLDAGEPRAEGSDWLTGTHRKLRAAFNEASQPVLDLPVMATSYAGTLIPGSK
jgi:hypothetical protein